jgi:nicotinate phosphoribosyltransferase
MKDIKVYGLQNGDYVLPNEPLLTLEGTLDKVQLVETTLLNLTNYPTLISSYTFRLREFFPDKILIEDGSVSAQSPYGAILGVKYSIVSSANMTTNFLASKYYSLPLFLKTTLEDMASLLTNEDFIYNEKDLILKIKQDIGEDQCKIYLNQIKNVLYPLISLNANNKKSSFIFEIKNREKRLEQITIFNICYSAITWAEGLGREVLLILNYLESIQDVDEIFTNLEKMFHDSQLVSVFIRFNPYIDESIYISKSKFYKGVILGPEYIVSCNQPALGMVYKINQIDGRPCMKFSEEKGKQTIPGYKTIIRLFSDQNIPIADFMCLREETKNYVDLKTTSINA